MYFTLHFDSSSVFAQDYSLHGKLNFELWCDFLSQYSAVVMAVFCSAWLSRLFIRVEFICTLFLSKYTVVQCHIAMCLLQSFIHCN